MYASVPTTSPVAVIAAASKTLAMPKSISLARPSPAAMSTFCGFMSRCTTPRE
jgi:hypothetical protein